MASTISTVSIDSKIAYNLAKSRLDSIYLSRKKMKDDWINGRLEELNSSFIHKIMNKLFGTKDYMVEDAEAEYETDSWATMHIDMTYGNQERVCKTIMKATSHAPIIQISLSDLSLIE